MGSRRKPDGRPGDGERDEGRPSAEDARTVLALAALALLAAVLLALAGCSSVFEAEREGLTVRAGDGVVTLRNAGPGTIFYFLVERETAAVVDWIPCVDPEASREECPRVEDGETLRLGYDEILGREPGETEALLYWWHLIEVEPPLAPGQPPFEPDEIRSLTIELR